jgi:hypothetical protein
MIDTSNKELIIKKLLLMGIPQAKYSCDICPYYQDKDWIDNGENIVGKYPCEESGLDELCFKEQDQLKAKNSVV